jgi:hypothetical protein
VEEGCEIINSMLTPTSSFVPQLACHIMLLIPHTLMPCNTMPIFHMRYDWFSLGNLNISITHPPHNENDICELMKINFFTFPMIMMYANDNYHLMSEMHQRYEGENLNIELGANS